MNASSVLTGKLEFLNLGEVLQILGNNGSTGILRIHSKYAQEPGIVYFDKGDPVDSVNGEKKGVDALFSLFGWIDGEFEFREEPVKKKNVINKNRMEIILDGSRLVDDGKIEKLGAVTFKKEKTSKSKGTFDIPVIKGPFVDYMYVVDEEEFYEGDDIVIEGNYGNWMWVVLEGSIEISKKTSKGNIKILQLKEGAYVGSIASFLVEGNVRSATAKAVSRVQLGMLDTQRLTSEYAAMSTELRNVVKSTDKRLKQVTNNIIDIYTHKNRIKEYIHKKKPVIEQGKPEERIFSIIQGDVAIVRNTDHGKVPLAYLTKGDVFGHTPFLKMGHEPYNASVYASTDLKLSPLPSANIRKEFEKLSTAFKNILENLATSISVTSMVACEYHKRIAKKSKLSKKA